MRNYIQQKIIKNIKELCILSPEEYRDTFRNPEKDFTRNRKQPLGAVVRTGLLNSGSCLNQQLRLSHGLGTRPTASAYIQQRDKLMPAFFRHLFLRQVSYIEEHTCLL